MSDLRPVLEQVIERWRRDNIPIRLGVDATSITNFESRYAVKLPRDMREYFSTVDGMGAHYDEDAFFRFWPLEEVQPVETYDPEVAARYPNSKDYYLFFDYSVDLFMYAIRLQQNADASTPIARLYPQEDGSFTPEYESFTDVIGRYANNPDDLL